MAWLDEHMAVVVLAATSVASGAIAFVRWLYFLESQPLRSASRLRRRSAYYLAVAGCVTGLVFAAMLFDPLQPLRSFGLATFASICVDPMNLTALRAWMLRVVRALSILDSDRDTPSAKLRESIAQPDEPPEPPLSPG